MHGKEWRRVKVGELIDELMKRPQDAVVLMESGGGLSLVAGLDFVEEQGPGAPAEVILLPNMEE
jgi:superfamily II DNA helicase RecQ